MLTKCTWVDCGKDATIPQIGKDGKIWANLCDHHNETIETQIKSGGAKGILSSWVKAQGGAKKATESMSPEINKTVKVIQTLLKASKKFDTTGW